MTMPLVPAPTVGRLQTLHALGQVPVMAVMGLEKSGLTAPRVCQGKRTRAQQANS
jgi:hypothetical protein